jgi:uncharacterized protein (TIGR02466 family)
MEISPIFSVGIGKEQANNILPLARQLFKDNELILQDSDNGLRTTLRNYNSINDCEFLNNQNAVDNIKNAIKKGAENFYQKLGFDINQLQFEVVNFWLNEMQSGSSHIPHCHYGFQLSGCFYVDVPLGSDVIKFYTPLKKHEQGNNYRKEFNQYNSEFIKIKLLEGEMFFWESLMLHEVPALQFDGTRRSIAYDISISKKITPCNLKSKYKMNIEDYIAIYNINNSLLCEQIVQIMAEENWVKHNYVHPINEKRITYNDDLDISFQSDEATKHMQEFFEQCANDYINNFSLNKFPLQEITRIRFNRYKVGTNMKMHHDHIHTIFDGERKGVPILTFLALLNDDFEGGDFLMFDGKKVNLSPGDVIVFPSNFMYPHAVTTVTKGIRYSCVAWGY